VINRRSLLASVFAFTAVPTSVLLSGDALAHHTKKRRKRKAFKLARRFNPQRVRFSGYKRGTIVVDPRNHYLYLVEGRGRARRYGVGVGKAGLAFKGSAVIRRKAEWPRWTPTQIPATHWERAHFISIKVSAIHSSAFMAQLNRLQSEDLYQTVVYVCSIPT